MDTSLYPRVSCFHSSVLIFVSLFPVTLFLVADTQLYKSLCPSIHPSVHLSVHLSVRLSISILLCPPVCNNIVTPRHLFSFLLVLTHDKRDLSKLAKEKKIIEGAQKSQFCTKLHGESIFGGFKVLQGALKNASQHLQKRTNQ